MALALALVGLTAACATSHNPTFDPTQNKPVIPGESAGPGQGAGETGLLARGADSPSCTGGWVQPAPGTLLYTRGVAGAGLPSRATVVAVRFFSGPDPVGHIPYDSVVSRWVITLATPVNGRGRLLVEQRASGVQVVGYAAIGTQGWADGGWRLTAEAGVGRAGGDAVASKLLPAYQSGCVG